MIREEKVHQIYSAMQAGQVRDADDESVAREPLPPRRDLAAGGTVPELVSEELPA
jgi:hypothetical protein